MDCEAACLNAIQKRPSFCVPYIYFALFLSDTNILEKIQEYLAGKKADVQNEKKLATKSFWIICTPGFF